jgi:hypothetical protein
MDQPEINPDAHGENVRALMAAAGIPEEEAVSRLEQRVLLTFDKSDWTATFLKEELIPVLSKTLRVDVEADKDATYSVELILGQAKVQTSVPSVFVVLRSDSLIISETRVVRPNQMPPAELLIVIAACYVAGAAIGRAVGEGIPNLPPPEFEIPFDDFAKVDYALFKHVELGEAYLAGAGAIGNGFLWAARHVGLQGKLHVVDDDSVSAGNLQRQIWFRPEDIGKAKAKVLSKRAQLRIPHCQLIPAVCRLQKHPNAYEGPWLRRLIVGVDSRRARRHLQNEFPGEVFDASTTGSEEIVLHYNKQPPELACMGCIYHHDQQEVSADQAIAEQLGIGIAEVREPRITPEIARRICLTHPTLQHELIIGQDFATLYKQLCSSQKLRSLSGKQVVAPFAFVSVLAGALLSLEIIRRQAGDYSDHSNLWRVSPWQPPFPGTRQTKQRRSDCECCGRREMRTLQQHLWKRA